MTIKAGHQTSKAPFKVLRISPRRKAFVEAWWRARSADLRVRNNAASHVPAKQKNARERQLVGFNYTLRPGDIRLFFPWVLPGAIRQLVYFTILDIYAEEGLCLMAPFSRYGSPATSGEWLTGYAGWPLRVLELWNTRTAPITLITQSRLCGRMSQSEHSHAVLVFHAIAHGSVLPEDVRENVGLPIVHAGDPRIAYQEEESRLLQPLTRAAEKILKLDAEKRRIRLATQWVNEYSSLRLAAASKQGSVYAPTLLIMGKNASKTEHCMSKRTSASFDPQDGWEVRWQWPSRHEHEFVPAAAVMPGLPVTVYLKPDGQSWQPCLKSATTGNGHNIVCSGAPTDTRLWDLLSGADVKARFVIQCVFSP